MNSDGDAEVVRGYIREIFNRRRLESIADFLSADSIQHELDEADPSFRRGPEPMAQFIALYHDAFPDFHVAIEDLVAAQGRVVTRWTMTGTHRNPLMGIAASGRQVRVEGIRIDRIAGGKIAESWSHWDVMGMLRQIGAVPEIDRRPEVAAASAVA